MASSSRAFQVTVRRPAFTLALALAVAATATCGSPPKDITGIRLATTWTGVKIDQLEYKLTTQEGTLIAPIQRRPGRPSGALASGADIVVYLGDERGGTLLNYEVRGYLAGQLVASGTLVRQAIVARTVKRFEIALTPGMRARTDGAMCSDDGQCMSGVCADGVCCAGPCTGTCRSCAVPGWQGTCTFVPEGVKHPGCANQGPETCGFDGTCNGRGACRKQPAGTRCAAGRCSGSSIIAAGACDGDGNCLMGPRVTCAPFSCDGSSEVPHCFDRCTTSDDCVSGRECLGGSCGTKLNGASCSGAADCTSGFCVDGVCCESKCDGACLSCALPGAVGSCRFIADGVPDPRNVCHDQGPVSCGLTGACNGSGDCARYPIGTVCQPASCSTAVLLQSASRCDGLGNCQPGGQLTCAPFACASGACNGSCNGNADCAPGQVCDPISKSCGKKGLGQPCGAGTECASGFCVDGVCCNNDCQGSCRSCSLGSPPGTCTNTPAGASDPRRLCKDLGKSACNNDGTCNGNGGCHKYPVGTICGAGSCNVSSNTRTLPRTCDASGQCQAGASVSCGAYKCNGDVCLAGCGSDSDCVAPAMCIGGACGTRSTGSPCTQNSECSPLICAASVCQGKPPASACKNDSECASMHCVDGVCCDGACGPCSACNLNNFVGFCHPLGAGMSDSRCTTDPASSCQHDGACDGSGTCRVYPAGSVCGAATCSGSTRNNPRTCDGSGHCQDNGTTACSPFTCNTGANACFTTCTSVQQCAAGKICTPGGFCL
jgi:hypothetical protein